MAATVELRPNRLLLEHDFEGYKLNLHALPHWSHDLAVAADRVYPDEVQYSFVHTKLFALHNHLVADCWDHNFNFYYVDKQQQVRRVNFSSVSQSFENKVVYDVPAHVERKPGHFNLCLTFPSDRLAVVSDGTGYLHVISTPDRYNHAQNPDWKTLHSTLVLGEEKYFVLIDAHAQEQDEKTILHCLLQSIEQNDKHFDSVLTWVTFESDCTTWKQKSMKQLQGKGIVHYAALETSLSALYIASDNQFKFISDSEREISVTPKPLQRQIVYTWLQTSEDVTVTLKLPESYDKKLFHVNVAPLAIKLSYAGNTLVEGKLKHAIDSELTTWNVENGKVDILLTKSDSMLWDEFLQGGDPYGEQIMDPSLVEEAHRRLMHLCSETEVTSVDQSAPGFSTQELEECDAASEEDTVLVRFDAINHAITHRIPLSVHQYLFSISLEAKQVPALALRHDVDACVWQPYAQLPNSETWPLKHQGTLPAFGYVQSSKQNRKFVTCSPDFSYSVVCEASRHIFVYRRSGAAGCQLRQRKGSAMADVKIGQQHLLNIDSYGEVVGISATNRYLFVLTESKLVTVEIA